MIRGGVVVKLKLEKRTPVRGHSLLLCRPNLSAVVAARGPVPASGLHLVLT